MSVLLRCAQGHEWERPAAARDDRLRCPVCGASPAAPLTESVTDRGPPGDGAASDETLVRPVTPPAPSTGAPSMPLSVPQDVAPSPADSSGDTVSPSWLPDVAAPASGEAGAPPPHPSTPAATATVSPPEGDSSDETIVPSQGPVIASGTAVLPRSVGPAPTEQLSPAGSTSAAPVPGVRDQTERLVAPSRGESRGATSALSSPAATAPDETVAPTEALSSPGGTALLSSADSEARTGRPGASQGAGPAGTEQLSGSADSAEGETVAPSEPTRGPVVRGPAITGYELLGVLGRGGMGVVYKARDKKLNRPVALKMIRAGGDAGAAELNRFRLEAEAVARLQHPNIVQIYEVGEVDGSPFFSLEYVDGGSLDKKMQGAPQPPRKAAEMVETLARAIHYAHQKGIIHRDLKPANVMMTSDGRLKVTDFGLAKKLEDDSGQTGTGAILGTPMYMCPEQAQGRTKDVGPPADVYALGAILYDMLTGRPPFRGETVLDTLQQVQTLDPVRPRHLQPKVPGDLETICLKALEKVASKRYATAWDLADDLRRFLDGEPIRARPSPPWERAWKWARRRPALAALAAVCVLFAISLTTGGLAYGETQRQLALHQADKARKEEERAREKEQEAETQRQLRIEAEAQRRRAEKNFGSAFLAVDQMLTRVGQERLAAEPRLEKVRRDLLELALQYYEGFLAERAGDTALRLETGRAHYRVGIIQELLGQYEKAERAYAAAAPFFEALADESPDRPDHLEDLAASHNHRGVVLQALGRYDEAKAAYAQALRIQFTLVAKSEGGPLSPRYRWDLGSMHNNMGNLYQAEGQFAAAKEAYQQALQLFDQLAQEFPDKPEYQIERAQARSNMGVLLLGSSDFAGAEKIFRLVLEEKTELARKFPAKPDYQKEQGLAYWNLALALQRREHPQDAEQFYRQAAELFGGLAGRFPSVPDYRYELAVSHNNLGVPLAASGRLTEAKQEWKKARDLLTGLAAEFDDYPPYLWETARGLDQLADACAKAAAYRGQYRDVESARREALALRENLVTARPREAAYWRDLVRTYASLAELLVKLDAVEPGRGRLEQAEKVQVAALAWHEKRLEAVGGTAECESDLGCALNDLAEVLYLRKRTPDALQRLSEAVRHDRAALTRDPQNVRYRQLFCDHSLTLARLLAEVPDHAGAARAVTDLAEIAPPGWPDYGEAAAALASCIRLAEKDEHLSEARRGELAREYADQTLALLRRAVARGYRDGKNFFETNASFQSLRSRDDFKKVLAELKARPGEG